MHALRALPNLVPVWTTALIGAVGCSIDSQPEAKWDGAVIDSAGVQIVQNFGTPLWTQENRWTVNEVLRIGVVEGEPEYQFGEITSIGVLSDGRIVVSDDLAVHIRFFSPEGVHEQTVGRQGEGPGEFRGPPTVLVGPGDTLLVVDRYVDRANRIAPDGTWLGSFEIAHDDGIDRWDSAPNGRIVSYICCRTFESPEVDVVVERDLEGNVLDTLAWLPGHQGRPVIDGQLGWRFYVGEPDMALCADGSAVTGRPDQYRLNWYDAAGDLERIVILDRPNAPFTGEDQSLLKETAERSLLEVGWSPAQIAHEQSVTILTDTYPAFVELGCRSRGSLWVSQVRPLSSFGDDETIPFGYNPPASSTHDVFDREGRFLGEVTLPKDFLLMTYRGDNLYGRWTDDLGVHYVMVLKIKGLPTPDEG